MEGDGWKRGRAKPEVGSQAGELVSFSEDAPSPLLLASRPWDPAASLPVQVGTDSGTVSLPNVLKLQLASFQ